MSSLSDLSSSDGEVPQRRAAARTRRSRRRMNPMEEYDEEEFRTRFRVPKAVIVMIVGLIGAQIMPYTIRRNAISVVEQILLTISFYATGAFQITVADNIRIHKTTACRIIKIVSSAIAQLRPDFIKMPLTLEEINAVKLGFFNIGGFPNVVGAVDGTHIRIQSPGGPRAELYRNRKGYCSLNVQAVCDHLLRINDVICRWPGSVHDTSILNDSHIRADFESGRYGNSFLLGDSGYPCRSYLLTPFLNSSTPSEEAYNRSHIVTRNTVERCFGVLKRRIPCLSMGLRVKLHTAMNIIVACCILHNIAINENHTIDGENEVPMNLDQPGTPRIYSNENTSARASLLLTHFNN